jgi:hypothetical protein
MPRSSQLQTTFFGKSLEDIHAELVDYLQDSDQPPRIEDAMTRLGYNDPFAREAIKRSFMPTLKEGGSNYQLTLDGRWQKGREKWAPASVPSGKVVLTYQKKTVPTNELAKKLETLNGDLSDDTRAAVSNIINTMENRANAKFDRHSVAFIAEDVGIIVSDAAALKRENALHEKYKESIDSQMQMMTKMVNKLTSGRGGDGNGGVANR